MELVIERVDGKACRLADKDFVSDWLEGDILTPGHGSFFVQNVLGLENILEDDKLQLINVMIDVAYNLGVSDWNDKVTEIFSRSADPQ